MLLPAGKDSGSIINKSIIIIMDTVLISQRIWSDAYVQEDGVSKGFPSEHCALGVLGEFLDFFGWPTVKSFSPPSKTLGAISLDAAPSHAKAISVYTTNKRNVFQVASGQERRRAVGKKRKGEGAGEM